MNVIYHANKNVMLLLGQNLFFRDKEYRWNKFCQFHDLPECKLIYNHMTRAMVSMTYEEFDNVFKIFKEFKSDQIKFLFSNYFIVPVEYDEMKQTDDMRVKFRPAIDDNYLSEVYEFLILPTTGCNARCFYCYERNMGKSTMTDETAEKVVQYICRKAVDKRKKLRLRWFGGEPLVNMKVIRYICRRLTEEGYQYYSSMISNGYLFSEKVVEEAKNDWKLGNVQITLDGTEAVYNKAKNYVYTNQEEVSPFKKVIDNIGYLTNNNISVTVRMNADIYNIEDLKQLVRDVHLRFPEHKNLSMYSYPIFEDEDTVRTDEDREILYKKIWEIEDVMAECDFVNGSPMTESIRSYHCMVDNGRNVTISPNGDLGLCEHYVDSDFWGHIDDDSNEKRDWSIIYSWRDYQPALDICYDCPVYPSCIRTKKCLDLRTCHPMHKEFNIRRDAANMVRSYEMWLEREAKKKRGNNGNRNGNCQGGSCQNNKKQQQPMPQPQEQKKEPLIKTFTNKVKSLFKKQI